MYECGTCGYKIKRKWSFDYHNNRKNTLQNKGSCNYEKF